MAKSSKQSGGNESNDALVKLRTRLALDRYVLGLWSDRELVEFLRQGGAAAAPLAGLEATPNVDRPRAAEKLRRELAGADKPSGLEKLEALVREGVDCAERGSTILPELQHDLLAHVDAVGREDPRAQAARILSSLAGASQVNVAIQGVGRLAEATVDRVQKARAEALAKLREALGAMPHLAPK